MFYKMIVTILICCLTSSSICAQTAKPEKRLDADRATLTVTADRLGEIIHQESISAMLHDGTFLQGKVIKASPNEIHLKLHKVEPKGRLQGKESIIPSSDFSVVEYRTGRKGGFIAAPIGMGIGFGFLGLLGAGIIFMVSDVGEAGAIAIAIGLPTGGAVGGALLGRELVKKTITIKVQPEKH